MIPFISHDDLGAYLETTLTGDELITKIALDGACEAIRQYLHRRLNLTADDEITMDGTWSDALILPQRPVHEVSDVLNDGDTVDLADTYLDVEHGILYLTDGTWWHRGRGTVSLTYTHGYALTEDAVAGTIERVPSNIRLVALRLAAAVWRTKGGSIASGGGAITGEHIGTYNYTQDAAVATELASMMLTEEDRTSLEGQRAVYAA